MRKLDLVPQRPPFAKNFGVKSIKMTKRLSIFTLFCYPHNGKIELGGTKITTSTPYAILHTSIYNVVIDGLVKRAVDSNIPRVATVANFGPCFSVRNVVWSKGGPSAPVIDLEVEAGCGTTKSGVTWRIIGANSMGSVNKDVMCLGFKDEEGRKPL
jgi:hypothetical protein